MPEDAGLIGRLIGRDTSPLVIAEMSGNHNGSLDRALEIVEAAARSGAHAVKIQTYTADTMTLDLAAGEFFIDDSKSLWKGQSLHALYQKAHTPWEWHEAIFDLARELGIVAFSSPFDATAVDFLETLDAPCYKIASFELIDLPLIAHAAKTGKPMIMSTGMATVAEIDDAVRTARGAGCGDIVLLKCTSTYPASAKDSNLLTIPHMRELFGCEVGVSDHTTGIGVSIGAVAQGATVIERHFTCSRDEGGVDAAFSLEPAEMRQLVDESKQAWLALGQVVYGPTEAEKKAVTRRRSLYVTKDLKAGEILTADNVRAIRPGLGLAPKHLDAVLGMEVRADTKRGTPLSWDLLKSQA